MRVRAACATLRGPVGLSLREAVLFVAEEKCQVAENLTPSAATSSQRSRGIPLWVWLLALFMFTVVAPVLACGALGYSFALGSTAASSPSAGGTPAVGIVRVEGTIISGKNPGLSMGVAAAEDIITQIEQARDNPSIRAVVLRIDSPGGGVTPSDEIYHALTQLGKPVVVSMGSLAASGGYYIAAPADYIYATPGTLTGSIGVISQFVTAQELLDELGVKVEVVKSGDVKDFGGPYRDMTEEEQEYWQSIIDESYERFVQIVAEGRGLEIESVREVADGRIITGQQAVELGLVDAIGYFDDAVRKAGELGGISGDPRIVELAPQRGLLEALYGFQVQPGLPVDVAALLRELGGPSLEYRQAGP